MAPRCSRLLLLAGTLALALLVLGQCSREKEPAKEPASVSRTAEPDLASRQVAAPAQGPLGLRVRVFGSSEGEQAPVSGAEISLRLATSRKISAGAERRGQTDEQGWYEFQALPDGVYQVEVRAAGYLGLDHRVFVEKGSHTAALKIKALATIMGLVTQADGTPIKDAEVRLVDAPARNRLPAASGIPPATRLQKILHFYHPADLKLMKAGLQVRTDEAGSFLLEGVPPHLVARIATSHERFGLTLTRVAALAPGSLLECTVRLKGVTGVKGRVSNLGEGRHALDLQLFDTDGQRWVTERKASGVAQEAFLIRDIRPGWKMLRFTMLERGRWATGRVEVQVHEHELADVKTLTPGPGSVHVSVKAEGLASGQPIQVDGMLTEGSKHPALRFSVSCDQDRQVTILGLPAGKLLLSVYPARDVRGRLLPLPGHTTRTRTLAYKGDAREITVDLAR